MIEKKNKMSIETVTNNKVLPMKTKVSHGHEENIYVYDLETIVINGQLQCFAAGIIHISESSWEDVWIYY